MADDDVIDPAPKPEVVPEPEEEGRDAEKVIGIDTGSCADYSYVPIPDGYGPFDRAITVSGVRMEHVDTDADGVWLYRPM